MLLRRRRRRIEGEEERERRRRKRRGRKFSLPAALSFESLEGLSQCGRKERQGGGQRDPHGTCLPLPRPRQMEIQSAMEAGDGID